MAANFNRNVGRRKEGDPSDSASEEHRDAIPLRDEIAEEILSAAQALAPHGETPEARAERIAQIKEAIDAGSYETDEKLEAALERMLGSFGIDTEEIDAEDLAPLGEEEPHVAWLRPEFTRSLVDHMYIAKRLAILDHEE